MTWHGYCQVHVELQIFLYCLIHREGVVGRAVQELAQVILDSQQHSTWSRQGALTNTSSKMMVETTAVSTPPRRDWLTYVDWTYASKRSYRDWRRQAGWVFTFGNASKR